MVIGYTVIADGKDITAVIKNHLVSLSITDDEGFKHDTLTLVLDDRNNHLSLPAPGAELAVAIMQDGKLINKGSFEVGEIRVTGYPEAVTITAHGSRFKSLKARHTQTYTNITVGDLVNTIAKRNSMAAKVSDRLKNIAIEHLNQIDETDKNLLVRLARKHDVEFKPTTNTLLFYQKDDFKKIGGKALPPITIAKSDCTQFGFTKTEASKYDAVIAKWRSNADAALKTVQIGSGKEVMTLKEIFATEQEAKERATTRYNDLLRGRISGNLTIIGNALIAGEHEIHLAGFRKQLITRYKCTSCTHTIDNNGYITTLKLTNKK